MKRGEVWWVNFDPSVGGEIRKKRPAVIVSNDSANQVLNRLQVVPMSSRVDRLYPSEVYLTVNGQKSKAMADQLTTVSKLRLINQLGVVTDEDLLNIEAAIKTQLDLS
jgi:mRNA interferase MazF